MGIDANFESISDVIGVVPVDLPTGLLACFDLFPLLLIILAALLKDLFDKVLWVALQPVDTILYEHKVLNILTLALFLLVVRLLGLLQTLLASFDVHFLV